MRNEIVRRLEALEAKRKQEDLDVTCIVITSPPQVGKPVIGLICYLLGQRLYFTSPDQGCDVAWAMNKRLHADLGTRCTPLITGETKEAPADNDHVIGAVPEGVTIEQYASDTLAFLNGRK